MTKEQLYKLIKDDATPTPSDIGALKELVERYPYFEIAKFIYLKAIYEYEVQSFKGELARLGVLLKNRESLFYYIFRDEYAQYFKNTGKAKLHDDKTKLLLDAFFDDQEPEDLQLEYETAAGNNNLASVDYLSYLDKETSQKEKEEKLSFRKDESFSQLIYIEDVDATEPEATIEEEEEEDIIPFEAPSTYSLEDATEEVNLVPLKHQNIIDQFIETSKTKSFLPTFDKTTIKEDKDLPIEEEETDNRDEELGDDVFFTETLAKIYTKQKRYQKAYEIIEHLSLKYPKKNSYFADQLRYLEKLIINSKYRNKK